MLMAARGVIPGLPPEHLVTVVVGLSLDSDQQIASSAKATLDNLPPPLLTGALAAQLQAPVIAALSERHGDNSETVRQLLSMDAISEETLVGLAERATETIGEIIATNESLLLQRPKAIEALYMNKQVRMSTADRLIDLAARNGLELGIPAFKLAAQALANELIPEPTEEPNFDDELFRQTAQLADQASQEPEANPFEADDEGEEIVKDRFLPLHAQIAQMSVTQKIRRAMLGTGAERMLLVRETNRLVATAAASSPMLNENDAARIASSRAVLDDVLRIIANNRSLTRSYQVKLNLISNPKTPLTFSMRMIPHLRENDIRSLAKSKNVPANIKVACRQQLQRKKR